MYRILDTAIDVERGSIQRVVFLDVPEVQYSGSKVLGKFKLSGILRGYVLDCGDVFSISSDSVKYNTSDITVDTVSVGFGVNPGFTKGVGSYPINEIYASSEKTVAEIIAIEERGGKKFFVCRVLRTLPIT